MRLVSVLVLTTCASAVAGQIDNPPSYSYQATVCGPSCQLIGQVSSGLIVASQFCVDGGYVFDVTCPKFGATGNGSTDDTVAVQAAVNAAGTLKSGLVYLPPGTYKLAGLSLPARVSIVGAGWSTSASTNTGTVLNFTDGGIQFASNDMRGWDIENLAIVGPGSGLTAHAGIEFLPLQQNDFGRMRHVYISGFDAGINITSAVWDYFDDIQILNCGVGVMANDGTTNYFNHFDIESNNVAGVEVIATDMLNFTDGVIEANNAGILFKPPVGNGPDGTYVNRTWFESNTDDIKFDLSSSSGGGSAFVEDTVFRDSRASNAHTINPNMGDAGSIDKLEFVDFNCGDTYTINQYQGMYGLQLENTYMGVNLMNNIGLASSPSLSSLFRRNANQVNSASQPSYQLLASADGGITPDYGANGDTYQVKLTAPVNEVFTPPNAPFNAEITFIIIQDGTGGRTLTWDSNFVTTWSDVGNLANKQAVIRFKLVNTTNNSNPKWVQTSYVPYLTGVSGPYIQNQNSTIQTADFNITGDAGIGGTLGLGITGTYINASSGGQINLQTAGGHSVSVPSGGVSAGGNVNGTSISLSADATHLAPMVTSTTAQQAIEAGQLHLAAGVGSVVFPVAFSANPTCVCSSTASDNPCGMDAGTASTAGVAGGATSYVEWICVGEK